MGLLLQTVVSGVALGGIYALIALTFNVIFNATGGVSFAHGQYITLGGFLTLSAMRGGLPYWLAVLIGITLTMLCGGLLYDLTVRLRKKVTNVEATPTVIAIITLAHYTLLENLQLRLWGADLWRGRPILPNFAVAVGPAYLDGQILWIILGAGVLFGCISLFFRRTTMGQAMMAASMDPEAAAALGVDVEAARRWSFALAGGVGAIAGVLVSPIAGLFYNQGLTYSFQGLAAAILGGLGNITGAIVGGLLFGLMQSVSAAYASQSVTTVLPHIFLLLVLILFPRGLLARGNSKDA